jgi:hypothetical protein
MPRLPSCVIALTLAAVSWAPSALASSGKGDPIAAAQKQLAGLFVRSLALEKAITAAPPQKKAKLKQDRDMLLKKVMKVAQQLESAIHEATGRRPDKRRLLMDALKRYAPAAYKTALRKMSAAQRSNTQAMLNNVASALRMFQLEHKRLPTSGEGLAVLVTKRILQRLPRDGWGSAISYERIKGPALYLLRSAGPDRKPKTRDDLLLDGAGKWRK